MRAGKDGEAGKSRRFVDAAGRSQHAKDPFEARHWVLRQSLVPGPLEDLIRIAVGGGSQNLLLNQMTADACGRPVIAGPVEGTGIGNILVQAMAVGQIKSLDEARAIVRNSFDVKRYEPRDTAKWDAAYARFREVVAKG